MFTDYNLEVKSKENGNFYYFPARKIKLKQVVIKGAILNGH